VAYVHMGQGSCGISASPKVVKSDQCTPHSMPLRRYCSGCLCGAVSIGFVFIVVPAHSQLQHSSPTPTTHMTGAPSCLDD